MKKYVVMMFVFLSFSCTKKYYSDSKEFSRIEKEAKISMNGAIEIYVVSFKNNFNEDVVKLQEQSFLRDHKRIVYLLKGEYYIGYRSKNDMRSDKNAYLFFLAKVNSKTGEISVVKY